VRCGTEREGEREEAGVSQIMISVAVKGKIKNRGKVGSSR